MNYFEDIFFNLVGQVDAYPYFNKTKPQPEYFWSLEYCHHGEMLFARNSEKLTSLEGPVVFWMRPNSYYRYGSPPGKARAHGWINCTGSRAERIITMLDELFPAGHATLNGREDRFKELFKETVDIVNTRDHQRQHQAVARLEEMAALLVDTYYEGQKRSPAYPPLDQVTEDIRQHPIAKWDFHAIATDRLHMSYSGFRKLFTRVNGLAPHEFVLMQRIYHAMALLRQTDLQIKSVAEQCGFEDFGSFCRLFKKKTGITPSTYQRHLPADFENQAAT